MDAIGLKTLPSFIYFFMQTIDIIIAVLLVIGLIGGLRDGLVKQAVGFVGIVGGLLIGRSFYLPLGDWLVGALGMAVRPAHITAFVLILIVVPLAFNLMGWVVSKLLHIICLGWANRLLGGVVGMVKYALLAGVIITGVELFDKNDSLISESKKEDSLMFYPLYKSTGVFFKNIKEELGGVYRDLV